MKLVLTCFFLLFGVLIYAQKTVSTDKDWGKSEVFLSNAYEAEYIVRIGDIDNLGFAFPEGYDPFCGRLTEVHPFPWDIPKGDIPFMDRIMVSSVLKEAGACGSDGYAFSAGQFTKGPARFTLPTKPLKGVVIKNAYLQLFIDDFQAPLFCSEFTISLNDKIFLEAQRLLNAVNQTGPVGKLVTFPVPIEFHELITAGMPLRITMDEKKGAADGYAIDFIRLLVNRKRENTCKGNISGIVMDKATNTPIKGAEVADAEGNRVVCDSEGRFTFSNLPTGYEILTGRAKRFADGYAAADIAEGNENEEVIIYLEQGQEALVYNKKTLKTGDAMTLNNLLFDQGKADLRPESVNELNLLFQFLTDHPLVEIELSGHTSSEGEIALNKALSYKRVQSCRDYLTGKGIGTERIHIVGYGPDRPVAANDTEENRKKNRRVELRIVKN